MNSKEKLEFIIKLAGPDITMQDLYDAGQAANKTSLQYQAGAPEEDYDKFAEYYYLLNAINSIANIKFGKKWDAFLDMKIAELVLNFGVTEPDKVN